MNRKELVYQVVKKIPQGKVLTYKKVGALADKTNPRVVGNYLHQNQNPAEIPCHRVVSSDGKLAKNFAFGGDNAQLEKLRDEGIIFKRAKVDLSSCLWKIDYV